MPIIRNCFVSTVIGKFHYFHLTVHILYTTNYVFRKKENTELFEDEQSLNNKLFEEESVDVSETVSDDDHNNNNHPGAVVYPTAVV